MEETRFREGPQQCASPMPMRERSHSTLRRLARRLHDKACSLERLADEIEHHHLSPESDEAMQQLAEREFRCFH